jgi:hypothetical protein
VQAQRYNSHLIRSLDAREGCVISTTPCALYVQARPGAHCTGDLVGLRASVDGHGNLASIRIQSLNHPALKKSL